MVALARKQKCLRVVKSRRLFPIEGLLWAKKKCISFIFFSYSKAEQRESLLHRSYQPPMRPFAPSARLHHKGLAGCSGGAERLATPAWRLRKEFSSCFLRRKKGKKGDEQAKKQLGFTSTDDSTVRYQYWYIMSRVPNLSIDTRYCQYRYPYLG